MKIRRNNTKTILYTLIVVLNLIAIAIGNFTTLLGDNLSPGESIILGLISVMIGNMSFESWQNKNNDIIKSLENLKVCDIVLGKKNIANSVNVDVKKAKKSIRSTSFRENPDTEVSNDKFYELVAEQIKENNIFYETVYNHLDRIDERKKAFIDSGIINENDTEKIIHHKSNSLQRYFNVLIIDKSIAYIGFPSFKHNKHMQSVIRVQNNSKEAIEFIDNLYEWYQNFVITNSTKQNFNEVFKK